MRKSDLENFKALLQERKAQITKNIIDSSNEIAELRQSGISDEFDIASVNADLTASARCAKRISRKPD